MLAVSRPLWPHIASMLSRKAGLAELSHQPPRPVIPASSTGRRGGDVELALRRGLEKAEAARIVWAGALP